MMQVSITQDAFAPDAELAQFSAERSAASGALASFIGYCRGESNDGAVTHLELDHYPGFTEAETRRLAVKTAQRHDVTDLLIIHRVGVIPAREAIVLVAALSCHRAGAFAAVSDLMDYLKTDAPLWKREIKPGGARWIEPSAVDYARRSTLGDES